MDVFYDACIFGLPLFRWPTFVSSDLNCYLCVSNVITIDDRGWRVFNVTFLFDRLFAHRILAISIPIHRSQDMRVWRYFCHPKVSMKDLIEMYRFLLDRRMDVAWI